MWWAVVCRQSLMYGLLMDRSASETSGGKGPTPTTMPLADNRTPSAYDSSSPAAVAAGTACSTPSHLPLSWSHLFGSTWMENLQKPC